LALFGAVVLSSFGFAQQGTGQYGTSQAGTAQTQSSSDADNTKVNKRDRDDSQVTADQQKENSSDRELARKVRRALVADDSLSTYAHNVKVIAQGGTVTLKGPVRSDSEKQAVEAKAAQAAGGPDKIKSELSVKSSDTSAER
jgi:osmotically-inducible protein OsmY